MTLRLGTRASPLARAQGQRMAGLLRQKHPHLEIEMVAASAAGDRDLRTPLTQLARSQPNLWSDDLRALLRTGEIDGAVHSLKDIDLEEPPDLCLAAFPEREDPRDAWVAPFPGTAKIAGTCSLRRSLQLAHLFPGIRCEPIRGTVQSRIEQVDEKKFDGTVLALAGLRRSGLEHRATRIFSIEEMLPCAGQGVLTVECRSDDQTALCLFQTIDSKEIREAALAERTLHRHLKIGLEGPLAVYAALQEEIWHLWVKDFRGGPGPHPPYHLWGPSLQNLISQMFDALEGF